MTNKTITYDSEKLVTINLNNKNSQILSENITWAYFIQGVYDFAFIYLTYNLLTDTHNLDFFSISMIAAFGLMNLYFHYEIRKNRKWLKNTNETLYISTNSIIISKTYFNTELSRINIDTQGVIKIFYQPWSIYIAPPYLPDYSCGCIHIQTYDGDTLFGININEQDANKLIEKLIILIRQYHEPKNYIFEEIFQKEINLKQR